MRTTLRCALCRLLSGERGNRHGRSKVRAGCSLLEILSCPGRSSMTMERRRVPSGHFGCDSAHTIAIPGFGVRREGSAFFSRKNLSTIFGWRMSGNQSLNASARMVAWFALGPL